MLEEHPGDDPVHTLTQTALAAGRRAHFLLVCLKVPDSRSILITASRRNMLLLFNLSQLVQLLPGSGVLLDGTF